MGREIDVDFAAIDGILAPYADGPRGLQLSEVLPDVRGVELRGTRAGLARLVMVLLEVLRCHEKGESKTIDASGCVSDLGWVVSKEEHLALVSVEVVPGFEARDESTGQRESIESRVRDRLVLLGCAVVGFILMFLLFSGVLFWGQLLLGTTGS